MPTPVTRHAVAQIWLRRGIEDLYFSFRTDWDQLQDYSTFVMIMGLEKHLKAVLLYNAHADYEALNHQDARSKIDKLARVWSHRFLDMIEEIDKRGWVPLRHILERQHYCWTGTQLVKAITAGYQETRYPVVRESWRDFPSSEDSRTYHDPLGSSDVGGLIQEVCTACFNYLSIHSDLTPVLSKIHERHCDDEPFERFKNVYSGYSWTMLE